MKGRDNLEVSRKKVEKARKTQDEDGRREN